MGSGAIGRLVPSPVGSDSAPGPGAWREGSQGGSVRRERRRSATRTTASKHAIFLAFPAIPDDSFNQTCKEVSHFFACYSAQLGDPLGIQIVGLKRYNRFGPLEPRIDVNDIRSEPGNTRLSLDDVRIQEANSLKLLLGSVPDNTII